jgi:hypothetical protein
MHEATHLVGNEGGLHSQHATGPTADGQLHGALDSHWQLNEKLLGACSSVGSQWGIRCVQD